MIAVKVQSDGAVVDKPLDLHRISDIIQDPAALIWIDVASPTPDDLELLSEEFGFHHLALEDAIHPHQRARLDEYDTFLTIFFYALDGTELSEGEVGLSQIAIFAGSNYVVTVHDRPLPALDETSERWRVNYERIKGKTSGLLVYSILDAIVDGYLPLADQLSDRIDALEDAIFQRFDLTTQQEIFRLKREMLKLRHILSPERDVLNMLMRRDTPIFSDADARYFQDIYDHLLRVLDSIDTFRDLLSSAMDSYLTIVSNRLNQVMKTLTASSIILMSMTLVASVYGMNFVHMPELDWRFGYPMALGLMLAIGISLGALFRRIDWL